jgi:ureidoglycolate hydrolase
VSELPPPEPLSPEAFAAFGTVLRRDSAGDPFQVVHTDTASHGWRVALLEVPAGPLRRVHRHPDSEECFAPLHGAPCLAVAEPDAPTEIRLFRLDEPVCVRRNVWHEVVAADVARVFIAESAVVTGEPTHLDAPLTWAAPDRAER